MNDRDVDETYRKLGYEGQADYFSKKLPTLDEDFLSFEEYSNRFKNIESSISEPIEDLKDDDNEIKFEEVKLTFDYEPNLFYANLAKDSYKDIDKRKGFLDYKYVEEDSTENLATYLNEEKKELSFAIPGTSKAGDFLMDTGIIAGSFGGNLALALDGRYNKIDKKIKEVKKKYPDYNVSVSGHSAGGSLANYLGIDNPDYKVNTFNMGQGLPFISNTAKCRLGSCKNINNFRIVGDWASSLSESLTQGNVFNLKPLIPTEEIQLEAESRETFFFPSYMNIPHTINQFIDRDSNKPLPDYAQYGRKLGGTIGGLVTALGVPLVSKKINSVIDGYINEAVVNSIFETRDLNFEGSLGDIATRINEFSLNIEDEIGLELPEQLGEVAYNFAEKSFERQARSDFLEQNPKIRYASNFFGGLENINDVVSGLGGFGIGDIVGTAVYESLIKPSEESLFEKHMQKKADTKIRQTKTETEIIDLDQDKYIEPFEEGLYITSAVLGGALGGIAFVIPL
jgi:NTP pyrophosphatase (non-canonical NTP hydrolase)